MVRTIEIFWMINEQEYRHYTTDIEKAISFLYRARSHKEVQVAVVSYVMNKYGHRRMFTVDDRGRLIVDTDEIDDTPPTKPGDPGWDPEITEWFYEDD